LIRWSSLRYDHRLLSPNPLGCKSHDAAQQNRGFCEICGYWLDT